MFEKKRFDSDILKFENCGNYMQKYTLQKSPRGSKADLSGWTDEIYIFVEKKRVIAIKDFSNTLFTIPCLKRLVKIRGRKI